MTPVRTPDVVRDVPGLLTYGMPVTFTAEGLDGERIECTGVVLDTPEPNTTWRVANLTDGVPADLYGDETRDMCPDWSSPLAIYAALHWLADRGHVCLWMLPTTHGGKVSAHADLTAWEVSAILVARSVVRVARGLGPVTDLVYEVAWGTAGCPPGISRYLLRSVIDKGSRHYADVGSRHYADVGRRYNKGPRVDERPAMFAKALADGCALLAPSGILLPD